MIKQYLLVTKPWIVLANLISAAAGFFLASRGRFDPELFLATMAGTALIVAAACVCNNAIDRRLDRLMERTRHRALATGAMSPANAATYAAVLGLLGGGVLWEGTNALALGIVIGGFGIYVGLYSLYLKRRSVYSTVIGSLAGAAPPLAAYCAAGNRFDLGAVLVLLLFSSWQIPHSYAITIYRHKDYQAAGIPVMSVARDIPTTRRHIVGHIIGFTIAALLLAACGFAGLRYALAVAVTGLFWLATAMADSGEDLGRWAKTVYAVSIAAVLVVSIMMAVDAAG